MNTVARVEQLLAQRKYPAAFSAIEKNRDRLGARADMLAVRALLGAGRTDEAGVTLATWRLLHGDSGESLDLAAVLNVVSGRHQEAVQSALSALAAGGLTYDGWLALAIGLCDLGTSVTGPGGAVLMGPRLFLGRAAAGLATELGCGGGRLVTLAELIDSQQVVNDAALAYTIERGVFGKDILSSLMDESIFVREKIRAWVDLFRDPSSPDLSAEQKRSLTDAFSESLPFCSFIQYYPAASQILLKISKVIRSYLLELVSSDRRAFSADYRRLAHALAVQFWLNEYIQHPTSADLANAGMIIDAKGRPLDGDEFVAVAMIRDPARMPAPYIEAARQSVRKWDKHGRDLFQLVLADRDEQQKLVTEIRSLAPIQDQTSSAVQSFYEQTPYPRWRRAPAVWNTQQLPFDALYPRIHPHARLPTRSFVGDSLNCLIAGCGTGQAVLGPMLYRGAHLTALDLSRPSMAFALQKVRRLGRYDVDFVHGDILDVKLLDRQFDIVECTGVVHHMQDPWAGVASLVSVMRPGGVMLLAVYSTRFRQLIAPAQHLAREIFDSLDGSLHDRLTTTRERLFVALDTMPALQATLLTLSDIYATSEFRDLMLHPVEHAMTARELVDGAVRLGLKPLGFRLSDRHRPLVGDCPKTGNIDDEMQYWEAQEEADPTLFAGMITMVFEKG